MKTLKERTQEAVDAGFTIGELSKAAGKSSSAASQWLSGQTKTLKADSALGLEKLTGWSATWWATGNGARGEGKKRGAHANVEEADMGQHRVPLIDYVQAGQMTAAAGPGVAEEVAEYIVTAVSLSSAAFALRIKGSSMEPAFTEGDVVIIDPREAPMPGDFVVAKNGEHEATFKKYRPRGVGQDGGAIFELVPLNEDYATMRSDQQHLEIIGTMVEHRKYRRR